MNLRLDADRDGALTLASHNQGAVRGQVLAIEQVGRQVGCLKVRVVFDGLTAPERRRAAEQLARFAHVERAMGNEPQALELEGLADRLAACTLPLEVPA